MARTSALVMAALVGVNGTGFRSQAPPVSIAGSATLADVVASAAAGFLSRTPHAAGISIGVVAKDGAREFHFGTTDELRVDVPTSDTLYPIASITKTFTGALLARAALDGRLRLDDDIRRHLDGDYPNLEFQGRPITLFQLLNHRSGLPLYLPNTPAMRTGPGDDIAAWAMGINRTLAAYPRSAFMADLHNVRLTAVPNTAFAYSNAGAQLAGFILERAYGRPYDALLKLTIAAPLGMRDTAIALTARQRARRAHGYDDSGRLMPDASPDLQGAGAIHSTLADMVKYVRWQMDERNEVVRLSHRPTFTDGAYSTGLNWQIVTSSNGRVIWQDGNIPGFGSLCIVEPERRLGLVILANESDRDSARRLTEMANRILRSLDQDAVLLP